ncbi:MAG: translation initiation factor IF-2 subunit alpha [Cenarchaeum symbiont of Oopsacas minuta]|nr:translation initiation factor IF-2 subunit alpha [Cenarchaeum symbiont of Oopsacas minuta]
MSMELPEVGEIIIATVTKIMDHGAYVTLDEYDDIQGFLHISEIAPGWIRSVSKYVKIGEKKVLLVKRVSKNRSDIDLSLKQISIDQKKKKLLEVKKYEKGKTLLSSVIQKAKLSQEDAEKLEELLYEKFDSVYDAFSKIARDGAESVKNLDVSKNIADAIVETSSKIRLSSVEIRGIMDISVKSSNGVETIRDILVAATKNDGVKISYMGAPKYRISVTASDFKSAERTIKPITSKIQQLIEKKKGTFQFVRAESKKTRDD